MSDRISILDLTHDEQNALDELVTQWRSKRTRNNLRTALYDMKNSERSLMSEKMPSVVRRRSFVLGWSALSVDKLNRRCNLDSFYDEGGRDQGHPQHLHGGQDRHCQHHHEHCVHPGRAQPARAVPGGSLAGVQLLSARPDLSRMQG